MNNPGPTIRALQMADIPKVAAIHSQAFPDSRSTRLGNRYIKKMFLWFYKYQPELSLVLETEGDIAGYVVGAIGGYGRKIFRFAIFEVAFGLAAHPKLWLDRRTFLLWRSYLQAFYPRKSHKTAQKMAGNSPVISAALAGIAVDPAMKGKGFGKLLLSAFEQSAQKQGAQKLVLSVHENNLAACRLYEGGGWKKDSDHPELYSLHYSKEL